MIISLASCRAGRSPKTVAGKPVSDTAAAAVTSVKTYADSFLAAKNIFYKITGADFTYQTFSSKIKFNYNDGSQSLSATAFVHILKDSIIWVSITGPFGIEAGRMLITEDSVKIIDKLHHEAQLNDIYFLRDVTGLPLDFTAMQHIITGRPFFTDTSLSSFEYNENNIILHTIYKGFANSITADTSSLNVTEYFILDEKSSALRSCRINNRSFIHINEADIAQEKNITILTGKEITADLEYRDIIFNEPLSFSFKIPENYTIRQ